MIRAHCTKTHGQGHQRHRILIDLEVGEGEFLGIHGPSGCGKTTMLRCLAGLDRPEEGRIQAGDALWSDAGMGIFVPPQRRRVAYMFQDHALFPAMTVLDNLRYAGASPGRARELLDLVRLENLGHRFPRHLSGGQSQRVALARALAMDPVLLLLDEPLSALDTDLRVSLGREIRDLQRARGLMAVMVSHDRDELERLCHRVRPMEIP